MIMKMSRTIFAILLVTVPAAAQSLPDAPAPQPFASGTVCLDSAGNVVPWSTSCGWKQVKEIPPAPRPSRDSEAVRVRAALARLGPGGLAQAAP